MDKKWDVFISYSRSDGQYAKSIYNYFVSSGLSVWIDTERITGGEIIREKINEGIHLSRTVLIILSKRSINSRWVLNEIDSAMMKEIEEGRTVPVLILVGKIETSEIPQDFRGRLFYDCRYNFKRKFDEIKAELIAAVTDVCRYVHNGFEIHLCDYSIMNRIQRFDYRNYEGSAELRFCKWWLHFFDEAFKKGEPTLKLDDTGERSIPLDEVQRFIEYFGRKGAEQLFTFLFDHIKKDDSVIALLDDGTIHADDETMGNMLGTIQFFFTILSLQSSLVKGSNGLMPIALFLKPGVEIGFGFAPGSRGDEDENGMTPVSMPEYLRR